MQMENLYLSIINNIQDGVYFVDRNRQIQFWNKAAENITGYTAEEMIGKKCQDSKLNHINTEGEPLCQVGCPLFYTLKDSEERKDVVFVRHKEGYRLPILVNIFPIKENGEIIGALEIFTRNSSTIYNDDLVTDLSNKAMYDSLTLLPNRNYFNGFLKYKVAEYSMFKKKFALIFADIDNFSHFNNKYGHRIGDMVLANIGNSLRENMRKDDFISRWGGEEFLGITSINTSQDAMAFAKKFHQLIANTIVEYNNESLNVSVSIGVTIVEDSDDEQKLIKRADQLMYQSKEAGKNQITSDF